MTGAATPSGEARVRAASGGASGIGAACARGLPAGAKRVAGGLVVVPDRDPDKARFAPAQVGSRGYAADLRDEQAVEACAARLKRDCAPVNVLFNGAGGIRAPLRWP